MEPRSARSFAKWGTPEVHGKERPNNSFIFNKKDWCPGWESNPHEEKSPEDFKSSASAIPPPGRWQYKLNESKDLVQHRHLSRWLLKDSGVGSGVGWTLYRIVQPLYGGQRVLRRKMRISHGHANGFVAEKLLHGENVHSGHYEAAGKRVTEAVPAKIRNLRVLENRLKPTPRLARATADEFRGRGGTACKDFRAP